jgi:glycosyltransferase involved in cell wall biosynthesis
MRSKTILLYCSGIDDVFSGSSKVAGIQVQMSFWAKIFAKHDWKVYSFSQNKSCQMGGVTFIKKKCTWLDMRGLSIIQEVINAFRYIETTKADVVFMRGARRDLRFLQLACKTRKAKCVFLGASDKDFVPGEELDNGNPINMKLFHKAMLSNRYYIVQNQFQADNLFKYYFKQGAIIPNIWPTNGDENASEKIYTAVWVANLRRLKRAEWFLNLAKQLPEKRFAIAGGVNEQDYYDSIKIAADALPNLDFLGALPLNDINKLLRQSKLLVCTSEFEGFPNTFLQAFANDVPVISTVDPSGILTNYNLGHHILNESELFQSTNMLIENTSLHEQCQMNIKKYFVAHHDADMAFYKVMNLIAN